MVGDVRGCQGCGAPWIVSHFHLAPVEAPAGHRRDGCTFSSPTAGNCVRLLVGGMRTVTAHAADQSPRTTPSRSLGKGTPDLFGHRRKFYRGESEPTFRLECACVQGSAKLRDGKYANVVTANYDDARTPGRAHVYGEESTSLYLASWRHAHGVRNGGPLRWATCICSRVDSALEQTRTRSRADSALEQTACSSGKVLIMLSRHASTRSLPRDPYTLLCRRSC